MGKVALITGGASGMGLATARALVKEGWTLAIADLNVASGEEAATELKGRFYRTNVGDYDDLANTFVKVWEDHGRLDFVFANAGILEKVHFYQREESDSRGLPPRLDTSVIDINLTSVINTSYLAVHFFRKNSTPGGALVMTASSGAIYPITWRPMYAGSKHGVLGFLRSIAGPLLEEGIRANCICPGAVRTNLAPKEEWDRFRADAFVPLEKIAEAVLMLVNDESLCGKAVELVQDRWKFRDAPAFDDEAMQDTMGRTGNPLRKGKAG